MKKTNKTKVEEFIRVDHAGERGAVKIYEGQLLALNTLVKNEDLKKTIEEMKVHEMEHCQFFEKDHSLYRTFRSSVQKFLSHRNRFLRLFFS